MARAMQAFKDHDEMFASMGKIWDEIALSESSTNIVVLILLAWGYTMFKVSRLNPMLALKQLLLLAVTFFFFGASIIATRREAAAQAAKKAESEDDDTDDDEIKED